MAKVFMHCQPNQGRVWGGKQTTSYKFGAMLNITQIKESVIVDLVIRKCNLRWDSGCCINCPLKDTEFMKVLIGELI